MSDRRLSVLNPGSCVSEAGDPNARWMPATRGRANATPRKSATIASCRQGGSMDLKDISLYVDDRPADGVFRVHRDVYSDPELFELEQKFIFERTWHFLALESQIGKPNNFVTAHIGRTPVLVTRDAKGRV